MKVFVAIVLCCFVLFCGFVIYLESEGLLHPQAQAEETGVPAVTEVPESQAPAETTVPETTAPPLSDLDRLAELLIPVTEFTAYNGELQHYVPEQTRISGHNITLTAVYEAEHYFSGKVESVFSFLYGDFSFRLRPIKGNGLFPAIWALPVSGSGFPELDIYESIGNTPDQFNGVLHYMQDTIQKRDFFTHYLEPVPESFVLSFHWDENKAVWSLDGKEIYTITENLPQEPMYFIMNLAVGGGWAKAPTDNSIFPAEYTVEVLEFAPRNVGSR